MDGGGAAVALHGAQGRPADGQQAFLAALADHAQGFADEVDVARIQPAEFLKRRPVL